MPIGRVAFPFGDGAYLFRLDFGGVRELQRLTDAGPLVLHRRLLHGQWMMDDVRETIRLGLIGGGLGMRGGLVGEDGELEGGVEVKVTPAIAAALVRSYVDSYAAPELDPDGELPPEESKPLPWTGSSILAAQILAAGLMGLKDEELGKKKAGPPDDLTTSSQTESSDSDRSPPPSPTGE